MMADKLWRVTVEVPMIVLADGPLTAKMAALENVRDAVRHADVREFSTFVRSSPVQATERLPEPWDGECIPWGEGNDRTIAEILSAKEEG